MSTHERLAGLPVSIESYRLEALRAEVSGSFTRHTTVVRLIGADSQGVGEDVTYDTADQQALQQAGATLPLAGKYTLAGFSEALDRLELFPGQPSHSASRQYRRWAFESAALDLALCQSRRSLHEVLGVEPSPVRFVVSTSLGNPPTCEKLLRWRELHPGLGFKLDAGRSWDDSLIEQLVALGSVDVVDFKGAYKGTPVDQAADPALYERVARAFPNAWLEDPDLTPAAGAVLRPHMERVTWDAPIHSVEDIRGLPFEPRTINFKPSRFGSLRALMDAYDYCRDRGIRAYGGGQFELGPGRGQIQYLASLFHPDASNDVAPVGFNASEPVAGLERSPLDARPSRTGFRRTQRGEP